MKILTKKVYRELFRFNKARSIAVIVTLTLTVGFLFGLANSKTVFYDSYDLNLEHLNTPTIRLNFNSFIDSSNISSLVTSHQSELQNAGVSGIEGRLFMYVQATYKQHTYDAVWVALNSTKDNPNQIDKLRTVSGNNYFENEDDALIIFQFAGGLLGGHDVKLDDKISMKLETATLSDLTIKGVVQSNEYTYVVDARNNVPKLGDMPIIYTSLDYAWKQLNTTHVINQIIVSTIERSDAAGNEALSVLSPLLTNQKAPIYNSISFLDTADRKFFEADAGSIDKFGVVLGGFSLIVGIILVYNSLTKLINSQRKYIGLLGAMGSDRRTIMTHYTAIGVILGVIGIFFGIIFSLGLTYALSTLLLAFYGFNWVTITFDPILLLEGSIVTLGSIALFSFLACFPVLHITPREAMTSTYTRVALNKRPILEKILKKLPSFKSISASIPLRETFMNKKRSSLTIIAIAVSSIILIVSGAMMLDMVYGIDNNFTDYKNYDGKVLINTIEPWENISATLENKVTGLGIIEPYFYLPLGVNSTGSDGKFLGYTPLEAVQKGSKLRNFHVIEGRLPEASNEILLGQVSAKDWNVSVNDDVILYVGELNLSISSKIVGIVGELIDVEIYTYLDLIKESFNLPTTYANGFLFDLESYNEDNFLTAETQIYNNFNVFQMENTQGTYETTQALFEVMIEFSSMFMLVGVFMVVAFTFNTIYVSYSDREMEYLALRAQGMKKSSLFKILSIETIILGVVGFIVSIPLSLLASEWGFDYMLSSSWYIQVYIPEWLWLSLFFLTMGSVILASYLVARRVNKAKLPDVLRNRQIG
jgi:putative ABC transport system permease protein